MIPRLAVLALGLAAAFPAAAGELNGEEARRLVVGKLFSYTCFEGTSGLGRVMADGSVAGTIRFRGNGPARYVTLPAGTIQVKGEKACASIKGLFFEPCFDVQQIDSRTFRGALAGFSFAYCHFTRRSSRINMARTDSQEPLALQSATSTTRN